MTTPALVLPSSNFLRFNSYQPLYMQERLKKNWEYWTICQLATCDDLRPCIDLGLPPYIIITHLVKKRLMRCKHRTWFLPDDQHTVSLVQFRSGWRHARTKLFFAAMDPNQLCPDSPVTINPHKTLNSYRGVISESDLLTTPVAEILHGFSDLGVIQIRRITIKKEASAVPTKHFILTFNSPKLPTTIKVGYLNCKIRPYIPNPLRCFQCQRFGHSQTSCHGQLTCSRPVSAGHSSTDCILEPKCINCSQPHPSNSKLCPK
ncbi:uncharacterized protein TNCV_2699281 [Trichonephila clavipes]|nr:uncharacterized protein TNCV_2699281 [Trichonephila clavipes]